MKRPPWGLRYAKFDAYAEAGAFGSVGLGAGVEGAWGLSGSRLFNFGLQSMWNQYSSLAQCSCNQCLRLCISYFGWRKRRSCAKAKL